MGVFNAANQWFGALIILPGVMAGAMLPVLSERIGANDSRASGKILSYSIGLSALVAAPLVGLGAVASPLIMAAYGAGFEDHWPTLLVALATGFLVAVQAPIGNVIAASGRMWTGLLMNLAWAAVFLGTTVLLIRWGALGLASSRFLAYAAHATWTFAFAYVVIRAGRSPHVPERI